MHGVIGPHRSVIPGGGFSVSFIVQVVYQRDSTRHFLRVVNEGASGPVQGRQLGEGVGRKPLRRYALPWSNGTMCNFLVSDLQGLASRWFGSSACFKFFYSFLFNL